MGSMLINSILSSTLPILLQFWWLFALLVILAICRLPSVKGWIGELIVNIVAKLFLDKKTYHLIKNITLPTENGTTQIDHIIVSKYGVFVVETKNYRGWIYGDEKQTEWTQVIYKVKSKFQNPLRQNYKHTKTLQEALDFSTYKIFSVIVFIGDCQFKTKMPENVTKGYGYIRYIKSKREELLSESDVQKIIDIIQSGRLVPSIKTHINHVKHVKELKDNNHAKYLPNSTESNRNLILNEKTNNERFMPKNDHIEKVFKIPSKESQKNSQADEEEFHVDAPITNCLKCNSKMSIIWNEQIKSYCWHCSICTENMSILIKCPCCQTEMRIRKNQNEYYIYCNSCKSEGLYHTV